MLKLAGRLTGIAGEFNGPLVVSTNRHLPAAARGSRLLLLQERDREEVELHDLEGFSVVFGSKKMVADAAKVQLGVTLVELPDWLDYLEEGDLVSITTSSKSIRVLFRRGSGHNSLLVTERCNSHCTMCSQPPKARSDDGFVHELIEAVRLMPQTNQTFGITGGEPLLAGRKFFELIEAIALNHPAAPIHVLTNGRLFSYFSNAARVAEISCRDLMFGIPLYSSIPEQHDFVVQAKGAFDQTIRGIINLKRVGLRVELRVVLHRQTFGGLVGFSEFVSRNLPMVDHVAFMGLEGTGHTKMNMDALWIDPVEYMPSLQNAVEILDRTGIPVSVYNLQKCILPPFLWQFARRSISDWKNHFEKECDSCFARQSCAGFFSTGTVLKSAKIRALSMVEVEENELAGSG